MAGIPDYVGTSNNTTGKEDSNAKVVSSPVEAIITLPIDSSEGSNTRRKKPAKPAR